ncbi:hypothetical protein GcC1_192002 [Golovinomyces cichoracearum]|uniref:Uncharacterized protein n=1 Tax=Golovinomyces cichoracearum TaxID=62708 RepID=A0A420HI41_9PEZI|nr:hypothetical protein GcC1_192002 [Golovinomyces cichoracearum]
MSLSRGTVDWETSRPPSSLDSQEKQRFNGPPPLIFRWLAARDEVRFQAKDSSEYRKDINVVGQVNGTEGWTWQEGSKKRRARVVFKLVSEMGTADLDIRPEMIHIAARSTHPLRFNPTVSSPRCHGYITDDQRKKRKDSWCSCRSRYYHSSSSPIRLDQGHVIIE